MTDKPKIFIEPGKRQGRRLSNEGAFRKAMDDGFDVFTKKNGVWFAIDFDEGGDSVYTALAVRPVGL